MSSARHHLVAGLVVLVLLLVQATPAATAAVPAYNSWFRLLTVRGDLTVFLGESQLAQKALRVGDTVLAPLSTLRSAWGVSYAQSPEGELLTVGTARVSWQRGSETFRLGLLDFPWSVQPFRKGGELYVPFRQLLGPLGATIWDQTPGGAVVAAWSTQWQKEPWLRQQQIRLIAKAVAGPPVMRRGPSSRKVIAFTFDDNWDPGTALKIAQLFRDYKGHCTFFLVGTNARLHPDMVRTMVRLGHDIGNHTLSHPRSTAADEVTFRKQVRACEQVLNGMGLTTMPWFRFPYFDASAGLMRVVSDQGFVTVGSTWNIEDTVKGRTAASIAQTIRKYAAPGVIFTGHTNDAVTYEGIKAVLPELARQGYTFVSLSELLQGS
jgi:peptidoglycan/xylan/chitin deacetylase (PgdA/CDA1 family)